MSTAFAMTFLQSLAPLLSGNNTTDKKRAGNLYKEYQLLFLFAFLYGLSNVAITINMLLGMLAGGGIFLLITLLGGFFYGKEAMGFGDVKLMAGLGLFFGLSNIIIITLLSFLIGAVLSIVLLLIKIKKSDEYIPFGPFIVIATFISMYVPFEQIKMILMQIFTLGMYHA